MKDKKGMCPGGLTDAQWDRVEYAAYNRMTADARAKVLALLRRGKIHAKANLTVRGRPAAAEATVIPGHVTIDEGSFSYRIGDFAFVVAHEARHTEQWLILWPDSKEADADASGCSNTWGRVSYFAGAYRATLGPCGSGLP